MPITPWEPSTQARILIIDDNPTVHAAFDEILRSEPANKKLEADEAAMFGEPLKSGIVKPVFEINHASSGLQGVELSRAAIEQNRPYQVAIVDIRMPGIDGVETIERMWALDSQMQTVICTAYADYRWEDLAKRLGQTDRLLVLKKPFHDVEVLQMVSTLAKKWHLARQAAMKFEQMEMVVAERTRKVLDLQQLEHQQVDEVNQVKLRYLSNLAQQFRGPLTLILNPVEEMMKGAGLTSAAQELIHRNTVSLLGLVDESLLMHRHEPDEQSINWRTMDLEALLRGMTRMFAEEARTSGVKIDFESDEETRPVWTDPARIEKTLFNLLTQSAETVSAPGSILIRLCFEEQSARVIVEFPVPNAVAGTPAQQSVDLESAEKLNVGETDIALLLSQKTLRLLKGSLAVENVTSGLAGGPLRRRMIITVPTAQSDSANEVLTPPTVARSAIPPSPENKDLPVVLLIEESADLRAFLCQGLGTHYRIIETEKFEVGLIRARESVPDLIVVGADSSKSDNLWLCAALKQGEITSHIPIILLTTDDSESNRLKTLEAGVDDCIAKPFRLPLLKARVDNLMESRRKLQGHFEHEAGLLSRELAANQVDVEFLRRVVEIVDRNLADYQFDMETLANQMAVSRRQLFRKFKAVAGCTPNVFIRDIRLKRAAQLLSESRLTVSQIIYAVGFSDPKYFRTVFRERFGVLPSDYTKATKPGSPS